MRKERGVKLLWIRVLGEDCHSLQGALVDLWQACATGKYHHSSDPNTAEVDPDFQYWAKVYTDHEGYARVRTIKPGAYRADSNWVRPPHIHFIVSAPGYQDLTTQMYFDGEALKSGKGPTVFFRHRSVNMTSSCFGVLDTFSEPIAQGTQGSI